MPATPGPVEVLVSLHGAHHNKTPRPSFASVNDLSPWQGQRVHLDVLIDHITRGKAWLACISRDGRHSASSAGASNLIVLDLDGDLPLEQFWAHPFAQRHCLFTYTSCSHGDTAKQEADGAPSSDRFRAIFCCEEHDDPALHGAIYDQVVERLGLQLRDHCGRKSERLWYGNDKAEVRFGGGASLAWDLVDLACEAVAAAAEAKTKRALERQARPTSGDDAIDNQRAAHVLLYLLNPSEEGGYNYWVKVLNAAASSQDEQVRQAFMDWHARGFHAVGRRGKPPQANVEKKYEKAGRRSTVGVILQLAKEQHGSQWWRQLPESLRYGMKPAAAPVVLMRSRGPIETIGDPPSFSSEANAAVPAPAPEDNEPSIPDAVSPGTLTRVHYNLLGASDNQPPPGDSGGDPSNDFDAVNQLLWRIYRLTVERIDTTSSGEVLLKQAEALHRINQCRNQLFAYPLYAREPWRIDEWLLLTFQEQHGIALASTENLKPEPLFTDEEEEEDPANYLIPDQILGGLDYVLYGRQATGKTTLALILSRAVIGPAKHRTFLDSRPHLGEYGKRRVLYIASDGHYSAKSHVKRYAKRLGMQGDGWLDHFDVVAGTRENSGMPWFMGLYELHQLTTWLDKAEADGRPYALVIFDSLKAICPPNTRVGDQIITQYLLLVQALTAPRKTSVLYVHHESKDGSGAQGAAGILEVVSGVFRIKLENGNHVFSVEKTRTDPKGNRDIPYVMRGGDMQVLSRGGGDGGDSFLDTPDDGREAVFSALQEHYQRFCRRVAHLSASDPARQYTGLTTEDLVMTIKAYGLQGNAALTYRSMRTLTAALSREKLITSCGKKKGWRLPHCPVFVEGTID